MGLDITAYRRLIDPLTREPIAEYMRAHVNYDFPGRAEPLEDRAVYAYEDATGFRAGSYGGYNGWRQTLAELAGYSPEQAWNGRAEGKPFVELVNFSDCEGVIGSSVAAKLAKDFAEWDERAKAFRSPETDFYDRYCKWREAFEMAADNGAVDFH